MLGTPIVFYAEGKITLVIPFLQSSFLKSNFCFRIGKHGSWEGSKKGSIPGGSAIHGIWHRGRFTDELPGTRTQTTGERLLQVYAQRQVRKMHFKDQFDNVVLSDTQVTLVVQEYVQNSGFIFSLH
jgi:hypothetical protein